MLTNWNWCYDTTHTYCGFCLHTFLPLYKHNVKLIYIYLYILQGVCILSNIMYIRVKSDAKKWILIFFLSLEQHNWRNLLQRGWKALIGRDLPYDKMSELFFTSDYTYIYLGIHTTCMFKPISSKYSATQKFYASAVSIMVCFLEFKGCDF